MLQIYIIQVKFFYIKVMIDPENDPILNASSINSEDYWFLKLNKVEQGEAPAQDGAPAPSQDNGNTEQK
jgi:hypothetical protein